MKKTRPEKHTPKLASKRANDCVVSGSGSKRENGSSTAAGGGSSKREHSSPVDTSSSKENISPEKGPPIKYGELIVVG